MYFQFVIILLLLLCAIVVAANKTPKWEIFHGTHDTSKLHFSFSSRKTYKPIALCSLGNEIHIRAKVVYVHSRKQNLKLRLEATYKRNEKHKHITNFEVKNCNFSPHELEGFYKYEQVIKSLNLCESFQYETHKVNGETYHMIAFYNNKVWWCVTYRSTLSYLFGYVDTDKCKLIKSDLEALEENLSADRPRTRDFDYKWSACNNLKQVPVCDKGPNFEIKASPMCHSEQVRYHIITYYNGYSLGTYTVNNMPEDFKKLCKLFNYEHRNHRLRERISVQYLNHGKWRCQRFVRSSKYNSPYYGLEQSWDCHRFRNYDQPLPVLYRLGKSRAMGDKLEG